MSWFNQKIYTKDEVDVCSCTSIELPSQFQIGEGVWLNIQHSDGVVENIRAIVAGVSIGDYHEIKYDLFFHIGNDFFIRVNGFSNEFRGSISKIGEHVECDGLVPINNNISNNLCNKESSKPVLTLIHSSLNLY
jgi:hypothetical protein